MSARSTTPWWRPRTLRRQLILGVSVAVTVVMLAVGVVSVLNLRSFVNAMNDVEVAESLDALDHSFARHRLSEAGHRNDIGQAMLGFTG